MAATRLPGTPRLLRALNDRAALELLLTRGPLTRAQLGELTGLSKVTASQLVERLEERGLVTRVGELAGGRGPNAQLYAVAPGRAHVVGVDVDADRVVAAWPPSIHPAGAASRTGPPPAARPSGCWSPPSGARGGNRGPGRGRACTAAGLPGRHRR